MNGKEYSDEIKAAAMAALLQGQSVNSVARQYKIPKGTISGWKEQAFNHANGVVSKATQKKEVIGNLLIEYIIQSLKTLQKQVMVFSNEDWLNKQSASEVAVLHGVIADKTIRLLEALTGNTEQTEQDT